MKKVGTLKELDLKPGDVVECVSNEMAKVSLSEGHYYKIGMSGLPIDNNRVEYPWSYAEFLIVSRASDKPKLWGDMTDAEKGALLLAYHKGKVIQYYSQDFLDWYEVSGEPFWSANYAYRVRPEPDVEVIELYGRKDTSFYRGRPSFDTHCITFNLVDGEIDCSSVKMRKL